MLPTLKPRQIIVAVSQHGVRPGDVVLFRHQGMEKIKRVTEIVDGRLFVAGDNSQESTDSRSFGWLEPDTFIAKVFWPRCSHSSYRRLRSDRAVRSIPGE